MSDDNLENLQFAYGYRDTTIIDPFAGEGEVLSVFKNFSCNPTRKTTVAIEIEKNRFDKIDSDYKFHGAFEDTDLPSDIGNFCYANPPYGYSDSQNGRIRNVRHYLQILLDKEIMTDKATMIMVVSFDDFLDCKDIIAQNFVLNLHYRVNPEEYSKWKQHVFYLERKPKIEDPFRLTSAIKTLELGLDRTQEFNKDFYKRHFYINSSTNFHERYAKFKKAEKLKNNLSKPDKIWDWAIGAENGIDKDFHLTLAQPPSSGRLSTLLACGLVSGKIECEVDGQSAAHIVSGGVKDITKKEIEKYQVNGENRTKTTVTRFSRPYLNILAKVNGKVQIKEIIAEE